MSEHDQAATGASNGCAGCEGPDRRSFLLQALAAGAAALTSLGATPDVAHGLSVRLVTALRRLGAAATYPIPTADGAMIDKDQQVILARYQDRLYAFALSCPHQNTALKWLPEEGRFQCPKHKSKYQPDGTFISGRATRGMDRFAIRREGGTVVVDLDVVYEEDKQKDGWLAATITLA